MIRNEFREYGAVLALSLNSSLAPSKLRSTLPLGPTVFFFGRVFGWPATLLRSHSPSPGAAVHSIHLRPTRLVLK